MNYNTNQSIFIQIAERICDRVLSGNYKADSRIPSVRELAVEMEVNPNTVMRSFERLQANEIIYNKRGIGYFVASDAERKIVSDSEKEWRNLFILFFARNKWQKCRSSHTLFIF